MERDFVDFPLSSLVNIFLFTKQKLMERDFVDSFNLGNHLAAVEHVIKYFNVISFSTR